MCRACCHGDSDLKHFRGRTGARLLGISTDSKPSNRDLQTQNVNMCVLWRPNRRHLMEVSRLLVIVISLDGCFITHIGYCTDGLTQAPIVYNRA